MPGKLTSSLDAFDAMRAASPDLGFSLYAMEPGGIVTLEIITPDGGVFTFKDVSARAAIDQAFPPERIAEPAPAAELKPEPSIFD